MCSYNSTTAQDEVELACANDSGDTLPLHSNLSKTCVLVALSNKRTIGKVESEQKRRKFHAPTTDDEVIVLDSITENQPQLPKQIARHTLEFGLMGQMKKQAMSLSQLQGEDELDDDVRLLLATAQQNSVSLYFFFFRSSP